MSINSIAGATSLLVSAVRPALLVTPPLSVKGEPMPTKAPPLEGRLNTFPLAVLAQILEQQQTLLDNSNGTGDAQAAQNVTDAGYSLASAQQAASAYSQVQTIAQAVPAPTQTLTI